MSIKEWAALLSGREYGDELSFEEGQQAKADGIVIAFGASDDLCEFRGAINDEADCYNGGMIYLTDNGLFESKCDDEDCPYAKAEREKCKTIEALWCADEYPWSYRTTIPHETFSIVEDGEPYCEGIVFELAVLKEGHNEQN